MLLTNDLGDRRAQIIRVADMDVQTEIGTCLVLSYKIRFLNT